MREENNAGERFDADHDRVCALAKITGLPISTFRELSALEVSRQLVAARITQLPKGERDRKNKFYAYTERTINTGTRVNGCRGFHSNRGVGKTGSMGFGR